MKKLLQSTTYLILISILLISFTIQAQFPEFTRIDTGSIYESHGSLAHFSGILFDIDNDGDLDPVLSSMNACGSPESPLALYRNERTGIYNQKNIFLPEYSNAFEVKHPSPMGDIDNDGDIDIVACNNDLTKLGVFMNDGFGNFLSDTSFMMQNSYNSFDPVLLDYNKDGYLDLLFFSTSVKVFYNNGDGTFLYGKTLAKIIRPGSDQLHSMAWGDADNDGDMDVYCGFSKNFPKNEFFINTGDSLESVDQNHITLSDISMTTSVNWVDYDNDGDMDLSVMSEDPDTINGVLPALYENLGNLEFEKHNVVEDIYRGSFTISDYWADVDNDGDLDLFISLEDGPLPFSGPYQGEYSPTPYNILYLNDGNGQFTNVLNHTLTLGEGHTAKIFDHDNDGDLDVLTIGNAYDAEGHNHLYINEGNDNSSVSISCVDKFNCASPYGTRVYAKTMINGEYVSQTREISLNDGNFAYTCTPIHFGLGDANMIDSLIIRWPSGYYDTCLDVAANQFYIAIENEGLAIDFKATNYIQYNPAIPDVVFETEDESFSINLGEHYHFIKGDTVPTIIGDTLVFDSIYIENTNIVTASINSNILTLESGTENGESEIQVFVDAGFTKRMDGFTVSRLVGLNTISVENKLQIFPNPFTTSTTIEYELKQPEEVTLTIYDYLGKQVYQTQENQSQGKHQIVWNAEKYADGIYYYRLQAGDEVANGKMVKVR